MSFAVPLEHAVPDVAVLAGVPPVREAVAAVTLHRPGLGDGQLAELLTHVAARRSGGASGSATAGVTASRAEGEQRGERRGHPGAAS